jgi:hypothetical protein
LLRYFFLKSVKERQANSGSDETKLIWQRNLSSEAFNTLSHPFIISLLLVPMFDKLLGSGTCAA